MSDSAIKVTNLYRYFGALKAVDGISFEIPHGSVCGFVGANGAGKTTTMRILASLDYPTMGTVEICGKDVTAYPDKIRQLIGWMPDHFGNYDHMTVLEYLDFYARALGYSGDERRSRVQDVMEFTDLMPLAEVMIMDEPAAGLDPKARVELKHLIRILAEEGKTVFISSHILSELGEMCDSLLFVNNGRIVHHGDAESLRTGSDSAGGFLYDVQLIGDAQSISDWTVINPNVEFLETRKRGGRIRIDTNDPSVAADVLGKMIRDGLRITEFHREERNLEDAFIDILGKIDQGNASPIQAPTTATTNHS